MSTFIIHLLVPPLMVASLRYFPLKYVWAWVWVSVSVDIDYIGWILYRNGAIDVNFHRALFHNVWWLVLLLVGCGLSYNEFFKRFPGTRAQAFHTWAMTWKGSGYLLSSYYYFSHMLLDTFQGGIALLFPLGLFIPALDFTLRSQFQILVDTETQRPEVEAEVSAPSGVVNVSDVYQWLSSEEFAFLLLFTMVLLLGQIYQRRVWPVKVVRAVIVPEHERPPPRP